jgi:hypothetical protein
MARIRVINKSTGQVGTVSEEFFDPSKYEQTGGQQQAAVNSGVKGDLGSAIKSIPLAGGLLSPFVNTAERIGGAGESLLRMFLANAADQAGRQGDTERALQLGELGGRESALTRGEKPQLTDPLQIAKDSAAMLSWGVPIKGASTLAKMKSALTPGALAGGGYSQETSLGGIAGDVGKGALISAGTTGVLSKLFPGKTAKAPQTAEEVGKEIATKPNVAEKFGLSMKRGVMRPEAGAGPQSILKENEAMMWAHNKGIDKGSAESMRYGVANIYNKDYEIAANAVKNSTAKAIPVDDVVNTIKTLVTEEGDFFAGEASQVAALNKELTLIKKLATNGQLDDKGIFEAVNNINQQLGKVSAKVGGRSDAAIQAVEGVRWDVSSVLHDMLREANPQAADTLLDMSMAHRVAKGLYKASLENANLFGLPIPGIAPAVQQVQNATGNAALGIGKIARGTQTGTQAVTPLLETAVGGRAPTALSAFLTSKPKTQGTPTTTEPTTTAVDETGLGISKTDLALIAMLPPKAQESIMEKIILDKLTNKSTTKNETQLARDSALKLSKTALGLLQSGKVKTGMVGGPVEALKGKFSAADQTTLTYQTLVGNLKATIAKARAGTSFTPNEEKMLNSYVPTIGDSYQEAQTKLALLQDPNIIARAQAEFEALGGK